MSDLNRDILKAKNLKKQSDLEAQIKVKKSKPVAKQKYKPVAKSELANVSAIKKNLN